MFSPCDDIQNRANAVRPYDDVSVLALFFNDNPAVRMVPV